MKRSRFSEERIIGILQERQVGMPAVDLCRKQRNRQRQADMPGSADDGDIESHIGGCSVLAGAVHEALP